MKSKNNKKAKPASQPQPELKPLSMSGLTSKSTPTISEAAKALLKKVYGEGAASPSPAPNSVGAPRVSAKLPLPVPQKSVWAKSRSVTEKWGAKFDEPKEVVQRKVLHTVDDDPVSWEEFQ